jgi:hypothetical protein
VLFSFFRLYRLPESLFFWGDIGRDHEMLMQMVQKKQPTLLGPSNSAIPFNQSAWYFYLVFPVFLLSSYSAFSTSIAGVILNVIAIVTIFLLFERTSDNDSHVRRTLNISLIIFLLLYTLNPLIIEQQRITWNPAFASPFLLVAFSTLWQLLSLQKLSKFWMIVTAFSLAFAVGMTYAVIPLVSLITVVFLISIPRQEKFLFLIYLLLAGGIVLLPHVLFELRYHFLLTKQLLAYHAPMVTQPFTDKLLSGTFFIFGLRRISAEYVLSLLTVAASFGLGVFQSSAVLRRKLLIFLAIFLLSFLTSVFFVDDFHSHYGLTFSVLFIFMLSQTPLQWKLLSTLILIVIWWPMTHGFFYVQPLRTVADLERCAELVCSQHTAPMYVTAQAWHGFHSGYDHSFFMNKHGCLTRDISTNPNWSNRLAVVTDSAEFDVETTSFHELALFGDKKLEDMITCSPTMSVYLFSRK